MSEASCNTYRRLRPMVRLCGPYLQKPGDRNVWLLCGEELSPPMGWSRDQEWVYMSPTAADAARQLKSIAPTRDEYQVLSVLPVGLAVPSKELPIPLCHALCWPSPSYFRLLGLAVSWQQGLCPVLARRAARSCLLHVSAQGSPRGAWQARRPHLGHLAQLRVWLSHAPASFHNLSCVMQRAPHLWTNSPHKPEHLPLPATK